MCCEADFAAFAELDVLRLAGWPSACGLAADPQKNIIFSWHEYTGGTQEDARITTSLEKSKTLGIVLINGEFASGGAGVCTQTIPYKFLLSEAQRVGTGWLAWSWDTNNSDCLSGGSSIFNMTTSLASASGLVSGWASDVVQDDPNSIKNTSVRVHPPERRSVEAYAGLDFGGESWAWKAMPCPKLR
jgi:Cellulase (glycosyl hydrolase family 5)